MTATCIGVDPGTLDGACAMVQGTRVVDWMVWWTLVRKGKPNVMRMQWAGARIAKVEVHLPECVRYWRRRNGHRGYRLAVEGLRAYPGKSNHQAMLKLSFSAGEVSGVLGPDSTGEIMRPLASEWRPTVLGLQDRCPAKVAEEYAIKTAPVLFQWAGGWPGHLRKDARGALAEAACIGRWGVLCRS